MNTIDQTKFLPKHFTEDDKIEYEILCDDARRIFKNIKDDWLIHIAVIAHINEKKGLKVETTDDEVAKVMCRYNLSLTDNVSETPYDPDFKMEDTMKQVIQAEAA